MSVVDAVSTGRLLWLLGHGIAESPSPTMQNAALRACGLGWQYAIRDVAPGAELDVALRDVRDGVACGANVTIPHKRTVASACDVLEGDAEITGAVNTVVRGDDGRLIGVNTDADGLAGALTTLGLWPEPGAAVVIFGAGGAAAAAALALGRSLPGAVYISARRAEAAAGLRNRLRDAPPGAVGAAGTGKPSVSFRTLGWSWGGLFGMLSLATHSVLVNATPASLAELPVDVAALPSTCTVVDLRYRPRPVDLAAAARDRGLRATDGLEMLLHQGMLSFQRWTGLQPPWDAARAALLEAVREDSRP